MQESLNLQNKSFDAEEEGIDFKKNLNRFLEKWPWFVLSVSVCLLISYIYYNYTPPIYQVSARILVSDGESKGGSGDGLMDLGGLLGSKNSVDNEIEILKTRYLMTKVVEELKLNIVYSQRVGLKNMELYQAPFQLEIIKGLDTIGYSRVEVTKLNSDVVKLNIDGKVSNVRFNQPFQLKGIGMVKVVRNPNLIFNEKPYICTIISVDNKAAQLLGQLSIALVNNKVSIIELGLAYPDPRKGEDILNALIKQYIKANLEDKNAIADSTTTFIKGRLSLIAAELGDVETDVENFKQRNKLADMSAQSKLLVENTNAFVDDLSKTETQISNLTQLESYLSNENNKRILPSSIDMSGDIVFSTTISKYNSLLVQRDKQLLSVTETSPFIQNLDQQISNLRKDLLESVKSSKSSYLITRNKLRDQIATVESKVNDVPKIEKDYLKLARNKQIKEELYIFLMQKAEETAISKTANISIAKTIDPPKTNSMPVSPKRNNIYLGGLFTGLIIPMGLILLINVLNTSVSTKEDIRNVTQVPIIGEISHNMDDDNLIVANKSRSAISEQFRALRTNLSFYLRNTDQKVILLTSSMSGEGKSFTAINLGNILALAGKKVLLMELDLRKPGLSAKLGVSNDIGFSNYTINENLAVKDIVRPLNINKNIFIISSGPLPPNPAETLMSERMPDLVNALKQEFDYIIMDAPPIGVIADAQLLANYADVTLYLVRQKVTQKAQLSIVEDLHQSKKMKNIGLVINDISNKYYGYGYGYGTYGEETKPGLFKKVSKMFS
ncbi:GumC family protein [Pedobacter alluvionis]|uniref:non-specific protein-tyrosine kinase n=1 Tax=Pedobacter alluvionis TaxID=475253 RepID=A0A497Y1N7_9SPHI|nr:tyrosine-protein kinase [Pedobacter alluvionis]RLJ73910.1 capsular exopolysaccharide synthesis family protein [Pedobacter alluvionis]TFB32484.1 polysaccharide biosynthesis tyrosine autokinase [Pedobacter alluvionis]